MNRTRFLKKYDILVKKNRDHHSGSKGLAIYELAVDSVTTRGENPLIAIVQSQCVDLVSGAQKDADEIVLQMPTIAETIPEYKVLHAEHDVGNRLGPIILAKIGGICCFHSEKAQNAYVGHEMALPE